MKKITSLFLTFVLLFSLAACGGEDVASSNSNADSLGNENISVSKNENSSNANNQEAITSEADKEDSQNEITFSEMVVVDNDECVIKITGIDPENFWGYQLNVQLENKSADKTYMYSVESAAINGVQTDPFFATDVAAGKKSNNKINFYDSDLEDNNIGNYTDIELTFHVYDSNDWSADAVARETIHVYPYGEDKASNFVRESKATDNIILDNEYVTVIVTSYEEDTLWGYAANLFFLNKTDKNIMFSVDEASINGYMADPFFAKEVMAGKCAFSSMSWSDTTLENNDIATVEEIEFTLRVYDSDDWLGDDFANENIVLKP